MSSVRDCCIAIRYFFHLSLCIAFRSRAKIVSITARNKSGANNRNDIAVIIRRISSTASSKSASRRANLLISLPSFQDCFSFVLHRLNGVPNPRTVDDREEWEESLDLIRARSNFGRVPRCYDECRRFFKTMCSGETPGFTIMRGNREILTHARGQDGGNTSSFILYASRATRKR